MKEKGKIDREKRENNNGNDEFKVILVATLGEKETEINFIFN